MHASPFWHLLAILPMFKQIQALNSNSSINSAPTAMHKMIPTQPITSLGCTWRMLEAQAPAAIPGASLAWAARARLDAFFQGPPEPEGKCGPVLQ